MAISRCPFTWGLFIITTVVVTTLKRRQKKLDDSSSSSSSKTLDTTSSKTSTLPNCEVVFVLGAPGTGKGTQCELLEERLLCNNNNNNKIWTHLSAGDLLREERNSEGSELGGLINAKINAGELVPSSITVKLLENAMIKSYNTTSNDTDNGCVHYLIDGFPRGQENIDAWNATMRQQGHTVKFVLNFECPEEVLVGRLLERGKDFGRSDDTMDVIRKRFKTHQQSTIPILAYLVANNTPVHTIDSAKCIEQVYESVVPFFPQHRQQSKQQQQ